MKHFTEQRQDCLNSVTIIPKRLQNELVLVLHTLNTVNLQIFSMAFKPTCGSYDVKINTSGFDETRFPGGHPAVQDISTFINTLGPLGGAHWLTNLRHLIRVPKEVDNTSALVITHFDYNSNILGVLKHCEPSISFIKH